MSSENKAKRRKRLKDSLKHNPIAKDLRTPKYKIRVVEDKSGFVPPATYP